MQTHPSFILFKTVSLQGAHRPWGWWFFSFGNFDTNHLFICNYCYPHSCNKYWYLCFQNLWNYHSCQNVYMINSASNTSILINLLVNHTLYLSITIQHVWGNNYVDPYRYQMPLRNILFHISNIHFWCRVIFNYFVVNTPLFIDFDQTVMTNPL